MKDYIYDFPNHLRMSMEIGERVRFKNSKKQITNIVICGLGGSGIGGSIINDILFPLISIPITINKGYSVPFFVSETTLAIVCSYSGNTEEVLSSLKECQKKGAEICIITSGGKLKSIGEKNNYNTIIIPAGNPPRAMFGYSFTQLFYALHHYKIINASFKSDLKKSISLLESSRKKISDSAKKIAKKLVGTTPVIYVARGFEGVAVRFRQQLNENSKTLCWHHVIPEMNHNELVGWKTNISNLSVVYFRNALDYDRNQTRIEINKNILFGFTKNISEVWSSGSSIIENTLYLINYGDWVSWHLSVLNKVDAIEIDVINHLKNELRKI